MVVMILILASMGAACWWFDRSMSTAGPYDGRSFLAMLIVLAITSFWVGFLTRLYTA